MTKLVRDVMKIGVPVCTRATTLANVARLMAQERATAIIVMDDFGACGVVSQSDLLQAFTRNYELLTAEEVMTDVIYSVSPDAPITTAAHMMLDERVHQVFVMHDHPGPARPSAVVTLNALVREMAGLEPEKPQMVRPPRAANKPVSN